MISIVLAALLVANTPHQQNVFKNMPQGCVYFSDKDIVACPGRVFDQDFQKTKQFEETPPAVDPEHDPNWTCKDYSDGGKVCTPKHDDAKPQQHEENPKAKAPEKEESI